MKKKHALPFTYFIVMFLCNYAAGFAHPVTPTLIVEHNLPSQWYGYAMSASALGTMLTAPFWGKICNHIPTKKLVIYGSLGYIVGQLVMCYSYTGPQLVLGRLITGLLACANNIGILNYMMNVADEEFRPRYLTIYATSANVWHAVGFFTGGMLGMISIEATFYTQCLVLATAALCGFLFLEDDTDYKVKPDSRLSVKDINPFNAFIEAKAFLTPLFMTFFVAYIVFEIGATIFDTTFNYYIKDFFKLGSEYNGTIKAAVALSGLVINSTIGYWVAKRTNVNHSFAWVTAAVTGMTALALFLNQSVLPFGIVFVLYSCGCMVFFTVSQTLVAKNSTAETNNAMMGFLQAMRSLGNMIGSFVQANLYAAGSIYAFVSTIVIMGLGSVGGFIYSFLSRRQK